MSPKEVRQLLALVALTSFGSALSAVLGFIELGNRYASLKILALALALKTLLVTVAAPPLAFVVHRTGIRAAVILSQLTGPVLLQFLYISLGRSLLEPTIAAIVLLALPGSLLNIAATLAFRLASESQEATFRRYQGTRGLLTGMGLLLAGLLVPFLRRHIGIGGVLGIDTVTYLITGLSVACTGILPKSRGIEAAVAVSASPPLKEWASTYVHFLSRSQALIFVARMISCFSLIGLIPLVASARSMHMVASLSAVSRESLWATEALALIAGNFLYRWLTGSSYLHIVALGCSVNAPVLAPIGRFGHVAVMTFICLCGSRIGMEVAAAAWRDNLILGSANHLAMVYATAWSSSIAGLLMTVSPLALAFIERWVSLSPLTFLVLGALQGAILLAVDPIAHRLGGERARRNS